MSGKLRQHISVMHEFKVEVIASAYPDFFSSCDSLEREVLVSLRSPEVENYLNFIDNLRAEVKRYYYKDKIVLLPRLQSDIAIHRGDSRLRSLIFMDEDFQTLSGEITGFFERMYYVKYKVTADTEKTIIGNHIEILRTTWELLLQKRDRLRVEIMKFHDIIQEQRND